MLYPFTKKIISKSTLLFPSFPQSLGGNPESFLKELDSRWSLSSQVVSGEPAGMTALTTIFGSMTAYKALLMNSLVATDFTF